MHWKADYIHAAARFFEAIGGGAHPECNQALESTPGCMLRAYLARAMKRRETIMRAEAAFHMPFPDPADCEIFVQQHQAGAECGDILRETTIMPAPMEDQSGGVRMVHLRRAGSLQRRRQRRLRIARQTPL